MVSRTDDVVVVGAGVVGLACAVRLQEAGAQVKIVAAEEPLQTVSRIAAAVWYPVSIPEVAGAQVLSEHVGLRPGRHGGARLEEDPQRLPGGARLIHCYGHAGAGPTLSWGCAEDVVRLVSASGNLHHGGRPSIRSRASARRRSSPRYPRPAPSTRRGACWVSI